MRKNKRRLLIGAMLALFQLSGIYAPVLISADNNAVAMPAAAPDLIIETISWLPATPVIGDKVTFYVTVKNQGDGYAGASNIAGYLDDIYQTSTNVKALAPSATTTVTFTWTAQAGSHTIKAIADYSNSVTESDEVNNAKTFAFPVLAPDLIIETITWSPESPSAGDQVTFTITIKNQGSIRAGASNVNLYIDGASRGYRPIPRIDVGASDIETYSWVAQSGSHSIKAVADLLNQVKESDETNNDNTVTYATAAPDLIIKNITWLPDEPTESKVVDFTVTIENQGFGKAEHSRIACYVDDNFRTSVFVSPLDSGDSTTANFTWTGTPGVHTIRVVADSENRIMESDETNNEKTTVSIALNPDLIVQSITTSPASPVIGQTVEFNVSVKNQGKTKVGNFTVYLYIDELNKWQQDIAKIDPGDTVTIPFVWTAQAGSHTVKAVADAENVISESNEANNERTITVGGFSGASPADLTVQNIVWSPQNPSTGDTVTFSVTIKNQGKGQAGVFHAACYIDGVCETLLYFEPIAAGATATKVFTWQAQPGLYHFKVVADTNNIIKESNKANNEKAVDLSIPAPDLVIRGITWTPLIPSAGEPVTFTVTIKNQGSVNAGNSYIAYYVDGSSTGYHDIQAIEAGATTTKTFSWTAQAGSHTIRVVADKDDQVSELDEKNNERIVVFPAPDLIVGAITWSPENPSPDDAVTFTVPIKNQGIGKAGYSTVSFYVDDSATGSEYIKEIDTGATVTRTFSWTAQAGSHVIKAVADGDDEITESDESNNDKAVTLSVSLPSAPASTPASASGTTKALADSSKEGPGANLDNKNSQAAGKSKASAAKPLSTSSSQKETWLKWWLMIGPVAVAGIALVVKLKFRPRSRSSGQFLNK